MDLMKKEDRDALQRMPYGKQREFLATYRGRLPCFTTSGVLIHVALGSHTSTHCGHWQRRSMSQFFVNAEVTCEKCRKYLANL